MKNKATRNRNTETTSIVFMHRGGATGCREPSHSSQLRRWRCGGWWMRGGHAYGWSVALVCLVNNHHQVEGGREGMPALFLILRARIYDGKKKCFMFGLQSILQTLCTFLSFSWLSRCIAGLAWLCIRWKWFITLLMSFDHVQQELEFSDWAWQG